VQIMASATIFIRQLAVMPLPHGALERVDVWPQTSDPAGVMACLR
jgi:hypothetical protein